MQVKLEEKDRAIQLRVVDRLSLKAIASQLNVAKSSVSLWLRDFPLSKEEIKQRRPVVKEKLSKILVNRREIPTLIKQCLKCSTEFYTLKSVKKFCSRGCYLKSKTKRQYERIRNADSVSSLRRRRKIRAIEYKSGCCILCKYDRCVGALKFHHLDPKQKKFGVSAAGETMSWERMKSELDKCILVCGNCHDEIHAGLVDLSILDAQVFHS